MREIKFRQPLFYKGEFNVWFYWGFTQGKEHGWTSPQNHQSPNYQYTGLKDKNDKEIYEGDVVSYILFSVILIGVVGWDDFNLCFAINPNSNDDRYHPMISTFKNNIEVIGNIYENPDLLRENAHD